MDIWKKRSRFRKSSIWHGGRHQACSDLEVLKSLMSFLGKNPSLSPRPAWFYSNHFIFFLILTCWPVGYRKQTILPTSQNTFRKHSESTWAYGFLASMKGCKSLKNLYDDNFKKAKHAAQLTERNAKNENLKCYTIDLWFYQRAARQHTRHFWKRECGVLMICGTLMRRWNNADTKSLRRKTWTKEVKMKVVLEENPLNHKPGHFWISTVLIPEIRSRDLIQVWSLQQKSTLTFFLLSDAKAPVRGHINTAAVIGTQQNTHLGE